MQNNNDSFKQSNKFVNELLHKKEIYGLRITLYVYILVLIAFLVMTALSSQSTFEFLSTSILIIIIMLFILFCLYLLKKEKGSSFIGLSLIAINIIVIFVMPFIWHESVGGDKATPPSFMLKTQIHTLSLVLIILSSLAIRPLYPALVSAGSILSHLNIFIIAKMNSASLFTNEIFESVNGAAANTILVTNNIVNFALAGLILTWITHQFRKMLYESVILENSNIQMSRYFSPGIVNEIKNADEDFFKPGGKTQNVAVLFSDIRGFTSMSETMEPEEVMNFLSEYQEKMINVIFKHGGTLDKFIGDGIMATFGTPFTGKDDVDNSVLCALEMNKTLEQINVERKLNGKQEIGQGIGIHYGKAIVGNVGSAERLEFTVIGDTVNVASRIESKCKTYSKNLIVSRDVFDNLKIKVNCEEIGNVEIIGKQNKINLYYIS